MFPQKPASRLPLARARPPDVATDGAGITVSALIHDPREIGAALGGRGDVAGPQAVCPERRGIEPRSDRVLLNEVGHGLGREAWLNRALASLANTPRSGDRPEQWARRDPSLVEPFAHEGDGPDEPPVRDRLLELCALLIDRGPVGEP
jgi:hypothetical protein